MSITYSFKVDTQDQLEIICLELFDAQQVIQFERSRGVRSRGATLFFFDLPTASQELMKKLFGLELKKAVTVNVDKFDYYAGLESVLVVLEYLLLDTKFDFVLFTYHNTPLLVRRNGETKIESNKEEWTDFGNDVWQLFAQIPSATFTSLAIPVNE